VSSNDLCAFLFFDVTLDMRVENNRNLLIHTNKILVVL